MSTPATTKADAPGAGWRFENSYARLPETLYARAAPAKVAAPRVVVINHRLAGDLGLRFDDLDEATAAALFAGQELPPGAEPLAQAYAGHQFGGFTMLGDGRAIVIGEHRAPDGRLLDVQLKGSGRTPFSRRGDGRAALGPMLREYIVSEAMHALGIPTTRSLAVATTGEPVYRERPLRGAVLTRVAASHLRVGTFEYVAALGDVPTLRVLADYAIARHYPHLAGAGDRWLGLLAAVAERQASLVARWQLVGFVHGVMNTDNMAISGETIDYGPCAFLDAFHHDTVFSSIDDHGRYAYGNQPAIAQWNLARFAETLLPLIAANPDEAVAPATEVVRGFAARFEREWLAGMRRKLGLRTEAADDLDLIHGLLRSMQAAGADFTNTFRDLLDGDPTEGPAPGDEAWRAWHARWRARLAGEGGPDAGTRDLMRRANPRVIPRNHRVEDALAAAEAHDDLSAMHRLLGALAAPYDEGPAPPAYGEPPPAGLPRYRTFCGT